MCEELISLFQSVLDEKNADIKSTSDLIIDMCQNVSVFDPLIQVFGSTEREGIRTEAAIALKRFFAIHWDDISQSSEKENMKPIILNLLKSEKSISTRHALLDSLVPVFRSELSAWPEFNEFLESVSDDIEYYFSILGVCFVYLPIEAIGLVFDSICHQFEIAFNSGDSNAIYAGSYLFSIMFSVLSAEASVLDSLMHSIIQGLLAALSVQASYANHLVNALSNLIESSEVINDPILVATTIIEIASNTDFEVSIRCLLVDPLMILMKKFAQEMVMLFPEIIQLSIDLSIQSYVDDCFAQQNDSFYSVLPLEIICTLMEPEEFYQEYIARISIEELNHVGSFACGLLSFIDQIPEVIASHFKEIIGYVISCLQHEHHSIMEAGLTILMELSQRFSSALSDVANDFFSNLFAVFDSQVFMNDKQLTDLALSLFVQSLYLLRIDPENLNDIYLRICNLIQIVPENLHYLAISLIGGFASIARENVSQYIAEFIPLTMQGCISDDSLIQSRSLESLSFLIKFAPNETSEFHDQAINHIIRCCIHGDDIQVFSSSLLALKNVSGLNVDIFAKYINDVISRVLQFLAKDSDDESSNDQLASEAEAKKQGLLMIAEYIVKAPQVLEQFFDQLILVSVRLLDNSEPEVRGPSLKVAMKLLKNETVDSSKLIEKLQKLIISKDIGVVSTGFSGLSKLLKKQMIKDIQKVKDFFNIACNYFSKQLPCQRINPASLAIEEEDEFEPESESGNDSNIDLRDSVIDFFACIAQYYPTAFHLEDFWSICDIITNVYDKVECIGVLVEYYDGSGQSIPSVLRASIIDTFYDGLKYCDFSLPPHPIAGVRCVVESSSSIPAKNLTKITKYIEMVLSSEYEGQFYYWQTVSSVVSLTFSVIRVAKSKFNSEKYLPKLIELSPHSLVPEESENIITSLINLQQTHSKIFQKYYQQILHVFQIAVSKQNEIKLPQSLLSELVSKK